MRADPLCDLGQPAKRAANLQPSSECRYVIQQGIARPDEIPRECGVLVASGSGLDVARPAPKRGMQMPFAPWMALARATPVDNGHGADAQGWLVDTAPPKPEPPTLQR